MEYASVGQGLMIRRSASWRIFRLPNGWGAMVFDPMVEEPWVRKKVDPQGADDGETVPPSSIASILFSQKGEAPQAVLRACDAHPDGLPRSTKAPKENG